MLDILSALYPWTKSLHVISVITWMAGIFYLPRLFVYHAEKAGDQTGELHETFTIMERKLFKLIKWIFGNGD